jgi:hypothetical protein
MQPLASAEGITTPRPPPPSPAHAQVPANLLASADYHQVLEDSALAQLKGWLGLTLQQPLNAQLLSFTTTDVDAALQIAGVTVRGCCVTVPGDRGQGLWAPPRAGGSVAGCASRRGSGHAWGRCARRPALPCPALPCPALQPARRHPCCAPPPVTAGGRQGRQGGRAGAGGH